MSNRRGRTVLNKLRERELGVKSNYNLNTKLLKSLICEESRFFKLIWERHSKLPIYYENHKVYLENYKWCYTINAAGGEPQILYTAPPSVRNSRIEDGLMCEFPVTTLPLENRGHCPSLLALASSGWLYRMDASNGNILQKIFLSKSLKFRYMSWNDDCRSVVMKTVLNKPCAEARRMGYQQSNLLTLCILKILPLEFVAMFEVTKTVFGKDITDAMVGENVLYLMHANGYVRLYSVHHIFEKFLKYEAYLNKECQEFGHVVGDYPSGLPLNVQLTSTPPLLFEVRCAGRDLSIGGVPWHYIVSPHNRQEICRVYSVDSNQIANNGTIEFRPAVRPDKVMFHPDESGRILHVASSELKVYRLTTTDSGSSLMDLFCINMEKHQTPVLPRPTHSRFGRSIRQIRSATDIFALDPSLITFSYENEVDILVVLGADIRNLDDGNVQGCVHLYDNVNGKLLKQLKLERGWIENMENNIILDLDVIINIRRDLNNKSSCFIYRLHSGED